MAMEKMVQFEMTHVFNQERFRHYINGVQSVFHCHHYLTLILQLADDAVDFEGERLVKEASEDSFFDLLDEYYSENNIQTLKDKIVLAQEYWQVVGMGLIRFTAVGLYAVIAKMDFSHVDQGWIDKFGPNPKPVNFITAGLVSAAASLFTGRPKGCFKTRETKSLVQGHECSVFKAVLG